VKDYRLKFKRQIEILGLVLNFPDKFIASDFEELFDVNELTIKRDLRELRSLGIDIHSKKGKGISVFSKIPDEVVKNIITEYIGLAANHSSYNQASYLLYQKVKSQSISYITLFQRCIENNFKVKIRYEKRGEDPGEERTVEPYRIFQSDKNWRLLARHDGTIKQFLLSNILSVEPMNKKFKPVSQKQIDEIFSTSFKSWLGNERYNIKLKLLPPWSYRIKPRQLMEFQKITESNDGSIIFETVVNSLKEISGWIVSRGEGVIVLEPEELKQMVINTAKGSLKNYK
jgi:predicted DNA-binding transcriptional regulator YafY